MENILGNLFLDEENGEGTPAEGLPGQVNDGEMNSNNDVENFAAQIQDVAVDSPSVDDEGE